MSGISLKHTFYVLRNAAHDVPVPNYWMMLMLVVASLGIRPAQAVVHASIVVDGRTGDILSACHPNLRAHPASLTKLMTLFITFRQLESGKWTLAHKLAVSRHAASMQPTKLWLRPGSTISVRAAILGITTRSANDAAVVLAEGIAGSEGRFARLMNREARRLGMTGTVFYNASGLPDSRQWTTAHDMAKLALALIHTYPQYYHFFRVRSFVYRGRVIYGHNHLLDRYAGTDGLKTGYVNASGFNIVTSAVRRHRRLIGVVLGGATARARDRRMMALLDRGFSILSPASVQLADAETRSHSPRKHRLAAPHLRTASLEISDAQDGRDWTIQIGGCLSSQRAARRILKASMRSAPSSLLPSHEIVVKLRGRRYRARFSHLSYEMAERACRQLRDKRFTCRILNHAPAPTSDLASASPAEAGEVDQVATR